MPEQNHDLLASLQANKAIQVGVDAPDWKAAIQACIAPLIKSGAVSPEYVDDIIQSVQQNGPYFIIADHLAMPHAQGAGHVNHDAFSLVTLKKPVTFDQDSRPVSVLIGLASNSPEMHVSVALPQIAALFEDEKNVDKMRAATSPEAIIDIIKATDLTKYLPK